MTANSNNTTTARKPLVAIVGRPNVGKSSLFNRIARRRVAIVHPEPGVTRDRIVTEVCWKDRRFDLADTGGIEIETKPSAESNAPAIQLDRAVRRQAEAALADADAVILMTDIESGLVPRDEEVASLLRRVGGRVFLAANKADNPGRDPAAADFTKLGFPVFPISAAHGRGLELLLDAVTAALPSTFNTETVEPLRVAVVGRPNVGKSSFINALLHQDRLIVSETPGTTRDSVDVPFSIGSGAGARHYVLTDTAGLRRIRGPSDAVELFSVDRARRSIERSDVAVLVLDATAGPTAQDKKIASLILEFQKACMLAINKWDLMLNTKPRTYLDALAKAVPFLGFAPVSFVSAKTGQNLAQCVEIIDAVAAAANARLPTGLLNRHLLGAYKRVQPPFVKGKRLKIYYAAQTGVRPITIRLFVNDPRKLQPQYGRYLVESLREAFGLDGAPIVLHPRHSRGRDPRNNACRDRNQDGGPNGQA